MRKFFVVLVWVMGLGLAALFAKDIVRGVKNVIAINHFTPVEVNNAWLLTPILTYLAIDTIIHRIRLFHRLFVSC